jgi:quercetin dioxygenase-like cupin family protein
MEKEQVKNIFEKYIKYAIKLTSKELNVVINDLPRVELIHELYDVYNEKPRFDIYINSNWFWEAHKNEEVFNSKIRELARMSRLVNSINYRIYYNTDVPERFDSLVSLSEDFKTELENYLSGYDSKDSYFEVEFVGPENTNWVGMDKMTARVIVRLNTIEPNNDLLIKAAEKTLNIALTRMVKKYDEFEGFSLHMDVEELDTDNSDEELPYDEEINESVRVRVFSENVDDEELKWHRDREDRLVEVIEGDGWEIQFDNELPKRLTPGTQIVIPEGVYHRVIKGSSELKIKVHFLY